MLAVSWNILDYTFLINFVMLNYWWLLLLVFFKILLIVHTGAVAIVRCRFLNKFIACWASIIHFVTHYMVQSVLFDGYVLKAQVALFRLRGVHWRLHVTITYAFRTDLLTYLLHFVTDQIWS